MSENSDIDGGKDTKDVNNDEDFAYHVRLSISGMGGVINIEAELIEKLLKEAGYNVKVDNPNADYLKPKDPNDVKILSEAEKKRRLEHRRGIANDTLIHFSVKHNPWGG